jgi:hypothetical protein
MPALRHAANEASNDYRERLLSARSSPSSPLPNSLESSHSKAPPTKAPDGRGHKT